jgi:hypothetical protein
MVRQTAGGYMATVYGISRTGFVSELAAWQWIAQVTGHSLSYVRANASGNLSNCKRKKS